MRRAPPAARSNGKPTLFYPYLIVATKWLGQGKPFEHAQQNVNWQLLRGGH